MGKKYKGYWKNDRIDGTGQMIYADDGTGTYADGDAFEGQWKADKPHGNGIFIWTNGTKYEG